MTLVCRRIWTFALALTLLRIPDAEAVRRPPDGRGRAPVRAETAPVPERRFTWGSGPEALGRLEANESSPECPASFTASETGEVTVLDQINGRLVTVGAGGPRAVPIQSATIIDLAPWGTGWALLDRKRAALEFIDSSGKVTASMSVLGEEVPLPGGITALARSVDGYWVEYDRDHAVLVARPDGSPVVRGLSRPGLPAPRSKARARAVVDQRSRRQVTLELWDDAGKPTTLDVRFPLPIWSLAGLEHDGRQIVVAANLLPERGAPAGTREELMAVALDWEGRERWRKRWRPDALPDVQHRSLRMGDDGVVRVLTCEPQGAALRRLP